MELGVTFPLQRQLGRHHLPYGAQEALNACWDLHGITLRGRSCLLAVHCTSRYTFTLYDVSPLAWADVEGLFVKGLEATCEAVGVKAPDYTAIAVTRTHGRRPVAYLNRAWEDVVALDFAIDDTNQCQPMLDMAVNQKVCNCAGFDGKDQSLRRFLSLFAD